MTQRQELVRLLENSKFEVIPLKNALGRAPYLPEGASVSVTASPAKDMEATLDLCEELQVMGLNVIPHLSARMTSDRAHLEKLLGRMGENGMNQVLVVGGDATDPGQFVDAPQLMATLATMEHRVTSFGITGYPEGHPLISDDALVEAMVAKAPHASYIATQMCFDVDAIIRWVREVRASGIDLPIYVGISGVVDALRLASVSARIGVGASLRYIRKNRGFVWKLLRPGPYRPTKLADGIARACVDEDLGIVGFHIFTFNEIERTVGWWRSQLERAGG